MLFVIQLLSSGTYTVNFPILYYYINMMELTQFIGMVDYSFFASVFSVSILDNFKLNARNLLTELKPCIMVYHISPHNIWRKSHRSLQPGARQFYYGR